MKNITSIAQEIANLIEEKILVDVEASGRHVHLSRGDVDALFGKGYTLTKVKDLSQPNQYVCSERLTLVGKKGSFENVVIIGPVRAESQVEVSLTDAKTLGLDAPIRDSGDIKNSPSVVLKSTTASVKLDQGLIVAGRHLHMTPEDAAFYNVCDNEVVSLQMFTKRPLIFQDVLVRVSSAAATVVHLDYDEANACGLTPKSQALIIKSQNSKV